MAQTILILGTDPEKCQELRRILQEKVSDTVVTTAVGEQIPQQELSDTIIITAEERSTGVLYRHLLGRLEDQVRRAEFLGDLIRLFSSSMEVDEILERVAVKSTEVLGDTAFIILNSEGRLRLEAAFSTSQDRLVKVLMSAMNEGSEAIGGPLLRGVLENGSRVVIENVHESPVASEMQSFFEKHGYRSLIATPIRTKEKILGAFVSLSAGPRTLGEQDVQTATALSDLSAVALEHARMVSEMQRSAITDSLTGAYNTRFFHEVLAREAARAQRYGSPLSLLMIDVDGFKLVNDTFGHLVGNKVLTQVSRIIEKTVRNTDFVFRCGGDEFGVVLPGTSLEGAMHTADKIVQKVELSRILQALGYNGSLTVSIGASEYRKGSHFETLVAEADQALYASKRSTKNTARAKGK